MVRTPSGAVLATLSPERRPIAGKKTLTCLAGAEPVTEAGRPQVQRLQFFLSESVLGCREGQRGTSGAVAEHDSGDRKDGTVTAFTGRQWLGRLGKTDNGIVTVTTLWADERLYYPLHALPYSPAHHFPKKRSDPGFRTKPQLAAAAAILAARAGVPDLWEPEGEIPSGHPTG